MQTSKNHFEAVTQYDDDTIRRMFCTEYYAYETARRVPRRGIS